MSDQGCRIREAILQDLDTIVRLVNAGGPDGKPRASLPKELPSGYRKAFETIQSDANNFLYVAECDEQVVGTFHLTFLTYLSAGGRPDAQLESLHVAADYRNRGIGTSMLLYAIEKARSRNCRRVQLTTDKRRTEAHSLYQRIGFEFSHEGAKLKL